MLALVQLPRVECPKIDNIIFSNVMNTVSEPVRFVQWKGIF